MRDSFIFYRSFFEAISDLPAKNQLELYQAIAKYSLELQETELSGLSNTIWKLIKPQLDANNKRFFDGSKGGRPRSEKITSGLEEEITSGFENKKPNNNVNVNVNVNENEKGKKEVVQRAEPSPKKNFLDSILYVFKQCYKENRNTDYLITSKGKETKAAGTILTAFKEMHPEKNSEAMLEEIKEFFAKAMKLEDDFLKKNISLSLVSSQLNQIRQKINSKPSQKPEKYGNVNDKWAEKKRLLGIVDGESSGVPIKNFPQEFRNHILNPENAQRYQEVLEIKPDFLIDYFLNVNFDKIISMPIVDAAQYFVNYYKNKSDEKHAAIKQYEAKQNAEGKKKMGNELFDATIDEMRPFLDAYKKSENDFKIVLMRELFGLWRIWLDTKDATQVAKKAQEVFFHNNNDGGKCLSR